MAYPRVEHEYYPHRETCQYWFKNPIIPTIDLIKQWYKESKGNPQTFEKKFINYASKGTLEYNKAAKTDLKLCADRINAFAKNEMKKKVKLYEYIKDFKPENMTLQTDFSQIDDDANNYQKTKTIENKLKEYAKRYATSTKSQLYKEKDKLEKLIEQNDKLHKELEFRDWVARIISASDRNQFPESALEATNAIITARKKREERNAAIAGELITMVPIFRAGKWLKKLVKGKSKTKLRPKKKMSLGKQAKARAKKLGSIAKRLGKQLLTTKKLKTLFGLALACAVNYLIEDHSQNIPRPKLPTLSK